MTTKNDSPQIINGALKAVEDDLRRWYALGKTTLLFPEGQICVMPKDHTMDRLVRYCLTKIPWELTSLYFGIRKSELFFLNEPVQENDPTKDVIAYIKDAEEIPEELRDRRCDVYVVGTVKEHFQCGLFPYHKLDGGFGVESIPVRTLRVHKKPHKTYNYERPVFAIHKRIGGEGYCVVAHVFPGSDYLRHYYYMIRFLLAQQQETSRKPGEEHLYRLHIMEFPDLHANLITWTAELDEMRQQQSVRLGDSEIAILGHVKEVDSFLNSATDTFEAVAGTSQHDLVPTAQSPLMFGWHTYKHIRTDVRITLLGFKYSYWGDTAYEIARCLYGRGTRLIIYIAKLGTLRTPQDKYTMAYIPNRFYLTKGDEYFFFDGFRNPILDFTFRKDHGGLGQISLQKHVVSSAHVSIATILEETYDKRDEMALLGATSVDNEIAYFAKAATQHNKARMGSVAEFSAVHFATDYLRVRGEAAEDDGDSMDNSSDKARREKKERILRQIIKDIVKPFLDDFLAREIRVTVIDDSRVYLDRWAELGKKLYIHGGRSVDVKVVHMSNVDDLAQLLLGETKGTMFRAVDRRDLVLLDWYFGESRRAWEGIEKEVDAAHGEGDRPRDEEGYRKWTQVRDQFDRELIPVEGEANLRVFGQLYLNRLGKCLSEADAGHRQQRPVVVITSAEQTVNLGVVPEILRDKTRVIPKSEFLGGVLQREGDDDIRNRNLEPEEAMRLYIELHDLCGE